MNERPAGTYVARKKDNSIYYRASMTCGGRHVSLGSYASAEDAGRAYEEARQLLRSDLSIDDYGDGHHLSFEKWVVICNYRDNEVYTPNPIYVRPRLFYYYFAPGDFFIFSGEDLFYYSAHKIQRRGGHYFVADYGSQINILSRYGIRAHAVPGRDYVFINGNSQDMQYSNVEVINPYHGVVRNPDASFTARIHVNGYVTIGTYPDAITAAMAYNKAADVCNENGVSRQYPVNYVDGLSAKAYADLYTAVSISPAVKSKAASFHLTE